MNIKINVKGIAYFYLITITIKAFNFTLLHFLLDMQTIVYIMFHLFKCSLYDINISIFNFHWKFEDIMEFKKTNSKYHF